MKLLLFISIVLSSFAYSNSCPGFVIDKKLSGGSVFSGKCDSNGNKLWGEVYYGGENEGQYYAGFFEDDLREVGTYSWPSGSYMRGFELQSNQQEDGFQYNFVGEYMFSDGSSHEGFFLGIEPSGFGFSTYIDDENRSFEIGTFITIDNSFGLDGYGARVFNDNWYWGFWEEGATVGTFYETDDEFENAVKYVRNSNGTTSGPYDMRSDDLDRLDNIMNFLFDRLEDYQEYEEYIDSRVEQYNYEIDEYNAFVRNDSETETENINSEKDLIMSIQELLTELGYSPGPADGIFGQRTKAAISAFQYELEIEITGLPSEELLVALQLAIKYGNNFDDSYTEEESYLAGTGSGFYISNNLIVSNFHVVEDCVEVRNSNNEILSIISTDVKNDMALLKGPIREKFLPVSSRNPTLGEKIYVGGFPLNSDLESFMITSGNVSSLNPGQDTTLFSVTAPIQPGNSGGPILDRFGRVVGIVVSTLDQDYFKEKSDYIPQNINLGIKNNVLKEFLAASDVNLETRSSYVPRNETSIANSSKESSELLLCYAK